MGGNALKKVKVQRIPIKIYKEIIQELIEKLANIPISFCFPFEVPGKEDFGDIDVLVDSKFVDGGLDKKKILDLIQNLFAPPEIANNGSVISFAYPKDEFFYQVDFILVSSLEMAQLYFSYGDCGAIIGRYLAFHGLTFGDSGLLVKIKESYLFNGQFPESDVVLDSILLSAIPTEVCNYLCLDYERWKLGFQNCEEIFHWLIGSRFFRKEFFAFMKMEHRKRLKLRKFYQNFLDFIQVDCENVSDLESKYELPPAEVYQHVMNALTHFNKIQELKPIEDLYLLKQSRREKFNSKLFSERGTEQTKLSEVMKAFKLSRNEEFDAWLDNHSKAEIEIQVAEWFETKI
jgi:hypothetical protein